MSGPGKEREPTEEEVKIEKGVDQKLSTMPRGRLLIRSGKYGAAVVLAAAVAGGAGGFGLGQDMGAQNERDRLFPPGALSPELVEGLSGAGNDIHIPDDAVTVNSLSDGGAMDISISPELEGATFLTEPSERDWLAGNTDNSPRPREEDATRKDLKDSVTSTSFNISSMRKEVEDELGDDLFENVNVVQGDAIDWLSFEYDLNARDESFFNQAGFILTSTTFEVTEGVDEEGVDIIIEKGVGIGSEIAGGPLSLIAVDLATEGPAPANLFAGGLVVSSK